MKKVDLGFLQQVRAGQDHLLGPPQTFQLSKGRHPSKKKGQFNPGARTKKARKKELE